MPCMGTAFLDHGQAERSELRLAPVDERYNVC
jgi:hypothetical protein